MLLTGKDFAVGDIRSKSKCVPPYTDSALKGTIDAGICLSANSGLTDACTGVNRHPLVSSAKRSCLKPKKRNLDIAHALAACSALLQQRQTLQAAVYCKADIRRLPVACLQEQRRPCGRTLKCSWECLPAGQLGGRSCRGMPRCAAGTGRPGMLPLAETLHMQFQQLSPSYPAAMFRN